MPVCAFSCGDDIPGGNCEDTPAAISIKNDSAKVESQQRIEMWTRRGDFGDDFGTETDGFRAGWKRGLEQVDVRDEAEHTESSRSLALAVITEESYSEPSTLLLEISSLSPTTNSHHDERLPEKINTLVKARDDNFVAKQMHSESKIVTGPNDSIKDFVTKQKNDKTKIVLKPKYAVKKKKQKFSLYDTILNCCTSHPKSPKPEEELNLLEDARDDDCI